MEALNRFILFSKTAVFLGAVNKENNPACQEIARKSSGKYSQITLNKKVPSVRTVKKH